MLCPAVSDPFYGRGYRLCAMVHQMILIPVIGKLIVAGSYYFRLSGEVSVIETPVFVSAVADCHVSSSQVTLEKDLTLTDNDKLSQSEGTTRRDYDGTKTHHIGESEVNAKLHDRDRVFSAPERDAHVFYRNGLRNYAAADGNHTSDAEAGNENRDSDTSQCKHSMSRQENGHLKLA